MVWPYPFINFPVKKTTEIMKVTFLGPAISRFLAAPEIACVLLHKKIQKEKAPPLHDPKTATAERRFGDFHQAMHPQRGLGILFLTQQILFGEIHSNE